MLLLLVVDIAPCEFGVHAGLRQWERPQAPKPAGPFQPSATFTGHRPGFLFTMGPRGLGYYLDQPGALLPMGNLESLQSAIKACSDVAQNFEAFAAPVLPAWKASQSTSQAPAKHPQPLKVCLPMLHHFQYLHRPMRILQSFRTFFGYGVPSTMHLVILDNAPVQDSCARSCFAAISQLVFQNNKGHGRRQDGTGRAGTFACSIGHLLLMAARKISSIDAHPTTFTHPSMCKVPSPNVGVLRHDSAAPLTQPPRAHAKSRETCGASVSCSHSANPGSGAGAAAEQGPAGKKTAVSIAARPFASSALPCETPTKYRHSACETRSWISILAWVQVLQQTWAQQRRRRP